MLRPYLENRAALRPLFLLWVLVSSIGLILLLVPEPKRSPLVAADGWEVTTGFSRIGTPEGNPLSSEILGSGETTYWRSWNPQSGSVPGRLVSKPFAIPEYISVPYVGYAGNPDTAIYLECAATGRRVRVATANAHETWTEDILRIPDSWCSSQGRLVAESHTTAVYIGAATPFTASFTSWIRESLFTVVFIHAFLFALLALDGLAVALLLQHWIGADEYFPLLVMAGATATGYLAFFVFDANSAAGTVWSWLVLGAGVAVLASRRQRGEVARLFARFTEVRWPVVCLFLVSLAYVTLLYTVDTGDGTFQATYRYAPAAWSTDNQLAQTIGEKMVTGTHRSFLQVFAGSGWKVSDRPPALTGISLLARPIFGVLLPFGENRHLAYYFYQIGGIIVMSSWILPFWVLCLKLGLSVRRSMLSTALVAASGFAVFNSTYIWPKMNAATLGLGAYLLLVAEPLATRTKPSFRRVCLAGGLAALGMLCHGGLVFGLVAVALLLCLPQLFPGWKPALAALGVFAAFMLPWTLWQRTVDPPGNALSKFALAGVYGFGEESMSVLDTVKRAYHNLTVEAWLAKKGEAIEAVFGRPPAVLAQLYRPGPEITSRWRANDFYFVLPSMDVLNAGWLVALIGWVRTRMRRGQRSEETPTGLAALLFVGVTGVLLEVLIIWDYHIIATNSYLSVLALASGLAILVTSAPGWWKTVLAAAQFVYFVLVWVASPLAMANRINFSLLAGWLIAVWALWSWSSPQCMDETEGPERAITHSSGAS